VRNYKNWSVRHLLYGIAAAAVLPAAILLAVSAWNQYKNDEAEAARTAYSIAQMTADNVHGLLSDARHVLGRLALRPGVRDSREQSCDPIFEQFKDLYPQFSNLSKADRRGFIVCSANPQPQGRLTFVGNAEWYRQVFATREFTLGPPYLGPVTGRIVSVLAQPLFDEDGVMTGSLQMPIDLARLRVVVGADKLPASTVIAVFDSKGVLVARSRGAEGLVGKDLSHTPGVKLLLASHDGIGRAITSDGVDRIVGFLPIPGTEWYAVAGIAAESVLTSAREAALRNLIFGGLTLLLVLLLVIYASKRISRPMAAVQDAARRATAGDLDARVPHAGPLEVSDFAAQFNHMLDAIKTSQNNLAHARSELLLLGTCMSHLTDMVIIMDAARTQDDWPPIIFVNDAFTQITGYTRSEVLGRPSALLHGPGTSQKAIDHIRACLLAQSAFREEIVHYTRGGAQFWVELDMIPIRDPAGVLTHWVSVERDVTLRKTAEQSIHRLAYYDTLTGLPNRSVLMNCIDTALAAAACDGQMGAVLFVDIDHFKNINDARGHAVGDAFIQAVAQRLATLVNPSDTLARLGGDEFVILLTGLSDDENTSVSLAMAQARRVCQAFSRPFDVLEQQYTSTASIGVALLHGRHQSTNDLLRESDTAMYHAKKSGRNQVALFVQDMQAEVELRLALEHELASAIVNQQMAIYVQTQVDCEGRPAGAEFLLRWHHPVRGNISPDQFIPIAEENGLIIGLGAWVLDQAGQTLATLREAGHLLPVAVNVSARQFRQPGFVAQVQEMLAKTGAPPAQLILEVTESLLIDDMEEAVSRMNSLAALGVRFSIDDFGTGYSSLAYLKRLPLHELKIDRSLVQDTPHDSDDTAIIKMILSMARHLNLNVVAEGVETREQTEFLVANQCHVLQGYFYSRPEALAPWLASLLARTRQEH
jgi:diguanylate cyclase (GGDEF)-like protein/PAS domain S-box-containing protein